MNRSLLQTALNLPLHSLFFLIIISSSVFSDSYKLTHPLYNPGFFSVFNTVLGALEFYENSPSCHGLVVDFEEKGLFYDEEHGANWWEYYFEPVRLGVQDLKQMEKFPTYKKIIFSLTAQFQMSRLRGYALIQKYIKLKPDLQRKIDSFACEHFKDYTIIGVHYRGTDKKSEAPIVSYDEIYNAVKNEAKEGVRFFIATDDANFLEYMQDKFPDIIVAADAIRSKDNKPIHYPHADNSYKKGEDAIIDCILLSKCSKLYKMASNLSDTSMKFNPSMPVIHINTSYSENQRQEKYNVFKTLNTVLGLLYKYERNEFEGGLINLSIRGQKYFLEEGANWWEYHFLPLSFGASSEKISIPSYYNTTVGLSCLFEMPKEEAHRLLNKYIRLKPEISEKIESFVLEQFKDHYIIGVHYVKQQGIFEEILQPSISYPEILHSIEQIIVSSPKNYKIFLCTNDKQLINQIKEQYSEVIFINEMVEQDTQNLIKERQDLTNCILLSKCDIVIGISTEMVQTVSQFNPNIVIKKLDTLWLEKK